MVGRGQYSLKELLYWFTEWCVTLCSLVTVITEPAGVFLFAIWFVGTTVINKVFGYRAGFGYAAFFGIVFWFLMSALNAPIIYPRPRPRFDLLVVPLLVYGIGSGSLVWIVAVGFDKLFERLSFDSAHRDQKT